MNNPSPDRLDATFAALADPTRRAILARLATGQASVTELAEPFEMSQPAISKHLKVLERAGLISRSRDAQRRPRRLEASPLAAATAWLDGYRRFWERSFRQLDAVLAAQGRRTASAHDAQRQETLTKEMLMKDSGSLIVTTPSDREIAMARVFDAPRRLVFDSYTKPEIVKRWLGVFGGWSMPVCEIDLKVGGTFRYVWRNADGREMGMRGVYREVVPPARVVGTEQFDDPWYEGEAVGTTEFVEQGGQTTVTMTVRYASKDIRDAILKSGMEKGVGASFDVLAEILAASE